ncbi:Uncharacterized protein OS=Terriglobus saanensis (strain ATCC BAA-1853 / DSM 23119 / SP1PR4) GN=AciPR4_3163 PE=4 SV=1: DUF4337: DUF4337 [Gemmata massiliana]|uniref:DUF4337 domain-containing protein n=1 Tax=Gemmata massiliana TaxID=1210884 RepID=A0A6P2D5Q6_9BACT|nr:DUF4337 family protein [Gemmata massiliana]VTR96469.1 Uncharacterized protein OS=Terriglobus saanensis (strain ATCC BAA-1853 / DSM 23119 / SP1PR4) GN=AciPR4_3163 PE=4 SV=1: DUF4337: DUF4337 [Gemmata massiliana]
MANTHEHLEHAEHAEHHASDPFNQRVAVSMAIVAAILAAISMVGHRTHNKVLQLQGDSNRELGNANRVLSDANRVGTEASRAETEKSNYFAWYQSKRLRQTEYEISATMIELVPSIEPPRKDVDEDTKKKSAELGQRRAKAADDWKKRAAEYNKSNDQKDNLPDLLVRGEEASKRADKLRTEAEHIGAEATEYRKQAAEKSEEAEHVHHQADRFDIAHLSAEIGLVLCSIALLTKKRVYWFLGLAAAAVAIALTASGYMIPHHPHAPHNVPGHTAPNEQGKPH